MTNAAEVAVNNYAIRRLYKSWRRQRPGAVELARITGLPLSHDIVSPLRPWRLADRVHPHLLDAIDPQAESLGARPAKYSAAASASTPPAAS